MGIAQQYLYTLFAAQLLLVGTLNALLAYVVAWLVVIVLINVGGRHLGHVAQDVGSIGIGVLADATPLDVETREAEHLLLEDAEVLVRELADEKLLGELGVAWVARAVFDGGHALVELFSGDA